MKFKPQHIALGITSLIALFLIIIVVNMGITASRNKELLYELTAMEQLEEEPEVPEEEQPKEEIKDPVKLQTNEAFNEEQQQIKEEIEDFKTLEELREEAAQQEEQTEETESSEEIAEELSALNNNAVASPIKKQELASNGTDASKEIAKNATESANRFSSASYSLIGRKSTKRLPNPTYTCMSSGTIVVNITVNNFGEVIDATVNETASTSKVGCLWDNAIAYATKARFNEASNKPTQLGTITYFFQGK